MRSIDRLEKNRRMHAHKPLPQPDRETEEEMNHRPFAPMNTAASIFDRDLDRRFGGINTATSIFDRGATMHTGGSD